MLVYNGESGIFSMRVTAPSTAERALPLTTAVVAPQYPPPRSTPTMAWNAWNTFSVDGKPLRGGRPEYESMVEAMVASGMVDAGRMPILGRCGGPLAPCEDLTFLIRIACPY